MEVVRKNTPNQYDLHGEIAAIVLHVTIGAYEGAVEWLMMSGKERQAKTGKFSESSAHYVIGRQGEITQLAPLNRGTWHAGVISKPSQRALNVLPKNANGTLKNPNRYTIGIEFAGAYDVDKDGVLEEWEKQTTKEQIKAAVELITTEIEPALKKKFDAISIITHRDITDYKIYCEVPRDALLAELAKARIPKVQTIELEKDKAYFINVGENKIEIKSAE